MNQEEPMSKENSSKEQAYAEETTVDVKDPVQEETQNFDDQPTIAMKISDLQRMSIEELNAYARMMGLRNLGSLT